MNSWKGLMDVEKIPFGGWSTTIISIPSAVIGGIFGGTIGLYATLTGSFLCGVCCNGGLAIVFLLISVVDSSDIFQYKSRNVMLFFSSIVLAGAASASISGYLNLMILDQETSTFWDNAFCISPLIVSIITSFVVIRVMHLLFMKSADSQKEH